MQFQPAPEEITSSSHCASTANEQRIQSQTIAQQIAEFEARGGKIKPIPFGVSGEADLQPIPKKRQAALRAPCIAGHLILSEAAKRLGIANNTLSRWIREGAIAVITSTTGNSRAKYIKESELIALKKSREESKRADQKTFVNIKEAAQLLAVHPTTITKLVNKGELKIEKTDPLNKHSKLIKTNAVLALKQNKEGNK